MPQANYKEINDTVLKKTLNLGSNLENMVQKLNEISKKEDDNAGKAIKEQLEDNGVSSTNAAIGSDTLKDKIAALRSRKPRQVVREHKKIGRNDPCPCGSGKKYKNCCLNSGKYEKMKAL